MGNLKFEKHASRTNNTHIAVYDCSTKNSDASSAGVPPLQDCDTGKVVAQNHEQETRFSLAETLYTKNRKGR